MMELSRVEIGKTGVTVPPLGLGLFQIGRNKDTKYPQGYDLPSDKDVRRLFITASNAGVTLLDTAPAYGTSERRLGDIMWKELGWPGGRDRWVISTKVGERYEGCTKGSWWDFSPIAVCRDVERSLQKIGVDYLDIVMLHSDGKDKQRLRSAALPTLRAIQKRGDIRAVGASVKTLAGARFAIEQEVDVLMIALNHTNRHMLPIVAEAKEAGVGLLIKKPLNSGLLARSSRAVERNFEFLAEAGVFDVGAAVVGTRLPQHLDKNLKACMKAIGE